MANFWDKIGAFASLSGSIKDVIQLLPTLIGPAIAAFYALPKLLQWKVLHFHFSTNTYHATMLFVAFIILVFVRYMFVTRIWNVLLIKKFYSAVNLKKIEAAWNCLSDDFKIRIWDNSLGRFKDGFFYSQGVNLLFCKKYKTVKGLFKYIVIYEDHVRCPRLTKLKDVNSFKIKDADRLANIANSLADDLSSSAYQFDKEVFLNMKLIDIMKNNFTDILRWKYRVDSLGNLDERIYDTVIYLTVRVVSIETSRLFLLFGKKRITGIKELSPFERIEYTIL